MKSLIFLTSFLSVNAFGWGTTGHRTVGAIAEKHLEAAVAVKINRIMDGMSLSRASTWPDEIKSDPQNYSYTYNWHYTEWRDEEVNHNEEHSEGKLIGSIREQVAVLKDGKATKEKKAFAIKFLVHLVGDLHMPLHVGNGLDRGGNTCKVIFHKKETNLHALWDEGMIDFTNLSFTELANYASQGKSRSAINEIIKGEVIDWALESKRLRSSVYPPDVNPTQAQVSMRTYCRSHGVVSADDMPKLAWEYSYKYMPVVEEKLFQGGVRLAKVLNQALR